jgi:hypothetical protein
MLYKHRDILNKTGPENNFSQVNPMSSDRSTKGRKGRYKSQYELTFEAYLNNVIFRVNYVGPYPFRYQNVIIE